MRRLVVLVLVLVGFAALVRADDSTQAPPPRQPWPELYDEYRKAHEAYGDVTAEIIAVQRLLRDADAKLAPLKAIEAQLASTVAPTDPRLGEARKAVLARVLELKVAENTIRLDQLVKKELESRETAIQAGTTALRAMLRTLDRLGAAMGINRQQQVSEIRESSLKLMKELDALENRGGPLLPDFSPLVTAVPDNPAGLAQLVDLYKEDAKVAEDLAESLAQRATLKRTERDHLLKLKDAGAIVDRLEDTLKTLDARLEEIDTARSVARKRADDLRKEIARVQKRKSDIEQSLSTGDKK